MSRKLTLAPAPPKSLDTNTLAMIRTFLAYDRTLMAWVRTAASLIGFGITLYKFFQYLRVEGMAPPHQRFGPREYGIAMIAIGLLTLILATIQHYAEEKRIRKIYPDAPRSMALFLACLVIGFGAFSLVITSLRI